MRAALDARGDPVDFFLRDDDGGWDDERLFALLDVVERHCLPLDLAVIPQALSPKLAWSLASRSTAWDGRLALHQHGFGHRSHEADGRKSEFGPARARQAQRRDLTEGREVLEARLPGCVQAVFTPPWNRCTEVTAELLCELGFHVLSRHVSEAPLKAGPLELAVSVDWSYAKRDRRRLTSSELGELAADRVRAGGPVGVNLHHAVMDGAELARLHELCGLIAQHPAARCRPMLAIAG
jgi:hypothetical protein